MQFDLEQPKSFDPYEFATHLIVPRPIAWVMTQSNRGINNLAPFSYFGLISDDPILFVLSIGKRTLEDETVDHKDTTRNLLENGQAVIHLVEKDHFFAMVSSSASLPATVSEVEHLGLETIPSLKVTPPRLKIAKFAVECVLERHFEVGNEPNTLFILRGVAATVEDSAITQGLPDAEKAFVIGKLGAKDYTLVRHLGQK
jgi:flavin reductase (DIM6/NTAB) family NADH-FMN oxidoreductase RutF